MTATSAAPTLGDSWNRQLPDNPRIPAYAAATGSLHRLSPRSIFRGAGYFRWLMMPRGIRSVCCTKPAIASLGRRRLGCGDRLLDGLGDSTLPPRWPRRGVLLRPGLTLRQVQA